MSFAQIILTWLLDQLPDIIDSKHGSRCWLGKKLFKALKKFLNVSFRPIARLKGRNTFSNKKQFNIYSQQHTLLKHHPFYIWRNFLNVVAQFSLNSFRASLFRWMGRCCMFLWWMVGNTPLTALLWYIWINFVLAANTLILCCCATTLTRRNYFVLGARTLSRQ